MSDEVFDIKDQVRIAHQFYNSSAQAADPTTVTLLLKTPAGVETSHVFGVDGNVVKTATGAYHYDLTLTEAGIYAWRWVGTGAVVCAEEGTIPVRRSRFTNP
ncbi:MAG: hypothetical protein AMXMBFR56_77040 [Polyangiaceae bacterium]